MDTTTSIAMLAAFGAIMLGAAYLTARRSKDNSKESYLVAGQSVGTLKSSLSIAVSWAWAPALFVSAQVAYNWGWPGLFYFMFGNTLALIVFGLAAHRLRRLMPKGFTFSGYIRDRFSARAQRLYLVQFTIVAICAFAVQVMAGGKLVELMTGLPYHWVSLALTILPLSYSLFSGLRASINTDVLQQLLLLGGVLLIVPWALYEAGLDSLKFTGTSGDYDSLFSGEGAALFLAYGLSQILAHLSGGFGDQMFWQRAWAVKAGHVRSAFISGAFLFAVIPMSLALLGFAAHGAGISVTGPDTQYVNLRVVSELLPGWVLIPFALMLLAGLNSTMDSALCAGAALVGHDGEKRFGARSSTQLGRFAMVALAVVGLGIAWIPGMQILYMLLFFGTVRAATMLPTLLALFWPRIQERGMFWGVLSAFVLGLPIFTYGNFGGGATVALAGSLITVATSGLVCVVLSYLSRPSNPEPNIEPGEPEGELVGAATL